MTPFWYGCWRPCSRGGRDRTLHLKPQSYGRWSQQLCRFQSWDRSRLVRTAVGSRKALVYHQAVQHTCYSVLWAQKYVRWKEQHPGDQWLQGELYLLVRSLTSANTCFREEMSSRYGRVSVCCILCRLCKASAPTAAMSVIAARVC